MDRTTYDQDVTPWLEEKGYRVVAVDLRGHGRTGWANSYRALEFAADLRDLIRDLDSGPAVIVGHSLGGVVGAALAAESPEVVRALFMEDPPLFQGDQEILQDWPFFVRNEEFPRTIRQWQASGMTVDAWVEEASTWEWRYPGETALDFFGLRGLRDWASSILSFDASALEALLEGELWLGYDPYSPLLCPVTVVAADRSVDSSFFPEHAEMLKSAVPQARIVFVPGATHEVHWKRSGLDVYLQELGHLLDSM